MESLSRSTVKTTPIIIDNGSTDGTREYVPLNYTDAVWMPQERNLGFGQANNLGMKYALEHQANMSTTFALSFPKVATLHYN